MPTIVVGQVTVPDLTGKTTSEAEADAAAGFLFVAYATETAFSFTVPFGSVVSQTPLPGQDADPNTAITVILSAGLLGPDWDRALGLIAHSFHWLPNVDGTVTGAYPAGNKP